MPPTPIASWSNVLATTTHLREYTGPVSPGSVDRAGPWIPRGAGRSFGDAAFVTDGTTLTSRRLDRILGCDLERGLLTCESGVEMGRLHAHLESTDWTFPVYGGTRWATVGGALAADIHGKNDIHQGSFGNHVAAFRLLTPDGRAHLCTPEATPDLFRATVGGMGLTGFVETVTLKLRRDLPRTVCLRSRSVGSLEQAIDRFEQGGEDFQFCTWTSCTPRAAKGLFVSGTYTDDPPGKRRPVSEVRLPATRLFNRHTIRWGGHLVHAWHRRSVRLLHVSDFNFIGIHERFRHWNRLYGRTGFIEYHFVIPALRVQDAFAALVGACGAHGLGFHFAVMKRFGNVPRIGLLSFPRPGYTMNFQMPDTPQARRLLIGFTDVVGSLGGRVYLAKEACIRPDQFAGMYDRLQTWRRIVRGVDPENRVQSDLSRRLRLKPW